MINGLHTEARGWRRVKRKREVESVGSVRVRRERWWFTQRFLSHLHKSELLICTAAPSPAQITAPSFTAGMTAHPDTALMRRHQKRVSHRTGGALWRWNTMWHWSAANRKIHVRVRVGPERRPRRVLVFTKLQQQPSHGVGVRDHTSPPTFILCL